MGAVGIKKRAGYVHDGSAAPFQDQTGFFRDMGQGSRLEVLLGCIGQELLLIFRSDNDSHTLLGFGDSQLGAVQALIFFRDEVEVYFKTVGKLADRDTDTARSEVIALFDHVRDLGSAEETLELALCGGIALLDLSAAGSQGLLGVGL